MDAYPVGFEEIDQSRSDFIRMILLKQTNSRAFDSSPETSATSIPKTLLQYWDDLRAVPDDVRICLDSWARLRDEGFLLRLYCDESAREYISERYGERESAAFGRCRHPAMRCDYFRMCFVLAEGGLYVDADDVLLGDQWKMIFADGRLKVQPLCFDIPSRKMLPPSEIWRNDLSTRGRVFYVNNDPIAAPAGHPVLRRALMRATERLLGTDRRPEIQSTTGPGNLTSALAAHANALVVAGRKFDFELLRNWDAIAETRWELSYRGDERNWRNMEGALI